MLHPTNAPVFEQASSWLERLPAVVQQTVRHPAGIAAVQCTYCPGVLAWRRKVDSTVGGRTRATTPISSFGKSSRSAAQTGSASLSLEHSTARSKPPLQASRYIAIAMLRSVFFLFALPYMRAIRAVELLGYRRRYRPPPSWSGLPRSWVVQI